MLNLVCSKWQAGGISTFTITQHGVGWRNTTPISNIKVKRVNTLNSVWSLQNFFIAIKTTMKIKKGLSFIFNSDQLLWNVEVSNGLPCKCFCLPIPYILIRDFASLVKTSKAKLYFFKAFTMTDYNRRAASAEWYEAKMNNFLLAIMKKSWQRRLCPPPTRAYMI